MFDLSQKSLHVDNAPINAKLPGGGIGGAFELS